MTAEEKLAAVRAWIASAEAEYISLAPRCMYPPIREINFVALADMIGEPVEPLPEPWAGPRVQYVKARRSGHRARRR